MSKIYKFNQNEIEDMVNLYVNEMKPIKFISEKYQVDNSVILKRLREVGINIPKGSAFSVKYWVSRGLTEKEAIKKVKQMKPNLVEYWLNKGFSNDDAKLKTELHLMNTKRAFIIKFGEEDGCRLYEQKKINEGKLYSQIRVEYWLNKGFTLEESKIKVSECQNTFSLKKCVKKYGEEEGLKIFTERQNRWQESLLKNGNIKKGFSKISQELFYSLLNFYDIEDRNKIKFATHNGEFKINNPFGGIYIYDFVDLKNKKIIEYNGDMYHANPKKYKKTDTPNPYRKDKTAQQIWEFDKIKQLEVKNIG